MVFRRVGFSHPPLLFVFSFSPIVVFVKTEEF